MGLYKMNSRSDFNFSSIGTKTDPAQIQEPSSDRCMTWKTTSGSSAGYDTVQCDSKTDGFICDSSPIVDHYKGMKIEISTFLKNLNLILTFI